MGQRLQHARNKLGILHNLSDHLLAPDCDTNSFLHPFLFTSAAQFRIAATAGPIDTNNAARYYLPIARETQRGSARPWSIGIDDQWRICFRWEGADAHDAELVHYH
jgi:hypothetical protein